MSDRTERNTPRRSRRRFLTTGVAVACLAATRAGDGADADGPTVDPAGVEAAGRRAKEAGLTDVRVSESAHYVAVGDAPDDFRDEAIQKVCEGLVKTYQTHFLTRKLGVTRPGRKLVVVILADRASYEAFKGEAVDESEGGHYDVGANRLVTYDFRAGRGRGAAGKRELNTFTLVHEATHQLTYNTGLLDRHGDVPVAVSEGFATYGETWRVSAPVIGRLNSPRLGVLRRPPPGRPKWIPLETLLTDDGLFADAASEQVAYAESWLLVYDLLQTPAGRASLRAYLDAIRPRRDPEHRAADAGEALGGLARLDAALKQAAKRLLR